VVLVTPVQDPCPTPGQEASVWKDHQGTRNPHGIRRGHLVRTQARGPLNMEREEIDFIGF
jgi:hypothetical protein